MEYEIKNKSHASDYKISKQPDSNMITTLNGNELTYDYFFENFMLKNLPCIIKNVTTKWESSYKWVRDDHPNLQYLLDTYGQRNITIYNCSERYFNSQKSESSTFTNFINYWKTAKSNENLLYLKDWHLKLQCKNDNFYEVPIYFASDWLNEYFTQCLEDDYRFVYIGPRHTWTPLHADVFSSYSWSVNVCGKKRWIMFPPGEETYLKDNLNNLPYDVEQIYHLRKYIEVIQNPGEAIFVPSGWYHQVWNLTDTISVNHNWVNGCNIGIMWQSLNKNLENIKQEIEDCKSMDDFDSHCQTMLRCIFGINHETFYNFLKVIAVNRLEMVNEKCKRVQFHDHVIGLNHILFDLKKIYDVLTDFINCDNVNKVNNSPDIKCLLDKILHALENTSIKF